MTMYGSRSDSVQPLPERLLATADRVHDIVWNRFVGPDGVLYDYVGPLGEVDLPTAAECAAGKPNALGWWSPIENGGFFNGIYLLSQCQRYERTGDPDPVRRLVAGLYRLQDVCAAPGMIARGIAADGRGHYPISSVDQCLPWLLGLRRYLATDIPDTAERGDCAARLRQVLDAVRAAGWRIPGEAPEFFSTDLTHDEDNWIGRMGVTHLAAATRMLADLGGPDDYERLLTEPLATGTTRLDRIAGGMHDHPWNQGWITATCQYIVRDLYRREPDPARKARFAAGLAATGRYAATLIGAYRNYTPGRAFTTDWRVMLPAWREQHSIRDAVGVAIAALPLWQEACPAVDEEKRTLLPSLPSVWNVIMSEDARLLAANLPEIVAAVTHFDYENSRYAALFYVENVVEELLARERA